MEQITFDQLPQTVALLCSKVDSIEKLLLNQQPETPTHTDSLLTIQQAAQLLTLSVPTIYGLVSRCEIPVSKKGKRLYFSRHELMAWIQSGRKKTTAEVQAEAAQFTTKRKRG